MCKSLVYFSAPHFRLVPPHFGSGPAPRGAFRSRALPNENCEPPSEVCAPKKVTGSVILKRRSRPETPKILLITPEFVSKNCFFADFAIKTFFCMWFQPRIRGFSHIFWDADLFWSSPQTSQKFAQFLMLRPFLFFDLHPRISGNSRWRLLFFGSHSGIDFVSHWSFCAPPQICLCPPSHDILARGILRLFWRRHCLNSAFHPNISITYSKFSRRIICINWKQANSSTGISKKLFQNILKLFKQNLDF